MTNDPDALELVSEAMIGALLDLEMDEKDPTKLKNDHRHLIAKWTPRIKTMFAAAPPAEARREVVSEALTMARDTFLFMHEMGGYVSENIRTAVHKIDEALGDEPTPLKCTTDHEVA